MRPLIAKRLRDVGGFTLGLSLLALPGLYIFRHALAERPPVYGDYAVPPHAENQHAYRIVAFGSSSTRGFGASSEAATYPAQLQALFGANGRGQTVEVTNRGINGEDLDGMLRRLPGDILARKPQLIVWQLGSNDALHHVDLAHFTAQLRAGVAAIRAAGCDLVLMGPQWSPAMEAADPTHAFATTIQAVALADDVEVIDRIALMHRWVQEHAATPAELVGADSVHLSDRGYALLARAVYDRVVARVTVGSGARNGAGAGLTLRLNKL